MYCTFVVLSDIRHSMFYQLRYIFLVFFSELILLGQVLSEQVISIPQSTTTTSKTEKVKYATYSLTRLENVPEFCQFIEQVETSQEENEKDRVLSCDIINLQFGITTEIKKNYQSIRKVCTTVLSLRLFLLFHCWKYHFVA